MTGGVPSGRRVMSSSPDSVYICFSTMSVVSPVPFSKSVEYSITGVRSGP